MYLWQVLYFKAKANPQLMIRLDMLAICMSNTAGEMWSVSSPVQSLSKSLYLQYFSILGQLYIAIKIITMTHSVLYRKHTISVIKLLALRGCSFIMSYYFGLFWTPTTPPRSYFVIIRLTPPTTRMYDAINEYVISLSHFF